MTSSKHNIHAIYDIGSFFSRFTNDIIDIFAMLQKFA